MPIIFKNHIEAYFENKKCIALIQTRTAQIETIYFLIKKLILVVFKKIICAQMKFLANLVQL